MHKLAILFSLAALLASTALPSAAATPTRWTGTSEIRFAGTSTLHAWSGTVSAQPFTAVVTMDENGNPTALKAKVTVKAVEMDTAKRDRDKNMRASMKAADFPLITGSMDTGFDKVIKPGEKAPSHLPFKLTLLGKDHQVDAAISKWVFKGDTATFDLDFDLSLKKCGITVPSVLGVIRVGDTIKVHAPVKLVRS
jgi:polyisoprenoid-binding protein YceI